MTPRPVPRAPQHPTGPTAAPPGAAVVRVGVAPPVHAGPIPSFP